MYPVPFGVAEKKWGYRLEWISLYANEKDVINGVVACRFSYPPLIFHYIQVATHYLFIHSFIMLTFQLSPNLVFAPKSLFLVRLMEAPPRKRLEKQKPPQPT